MEADGKVHEGKEEGDRGECNLPWGNDIGAGSWQMCGILRENSRWKIDLHGASEERALGSLGWILWGNGGC